MGRELRYRLVGGDRHWAVHETVSEVEGPITPEFKSKEELIEHLATRGTDWDEPWSREAAEDFVNRTGWAPSFIVGPLGVRKGYEDPLVDTKKQKEGGDEQPAREDDPD